MLRLLLAGACCALGAATLAMAATWSQDWSATGRLRAEDSYLSYFAMPFFAGSGGDILVGDFFAHLAAYGADGHQRWVAKGAGSAYYLETPGNLADAVLDADSSAWLVTGDDTAAGALTRIGADGQVQWSRPLPGAALARVTGGAVVVGRGWDYRSQIATKVNDDGSIAWQRRLPGGAYGTTIAAAGDGGTYIVQGGGSTIVVMRLGADGRIARTGAPVVTSYSERPDLRISAAAIYVRMNDGVHALDPDTLVRRWSAPDCGSLDLMPPGSAGAGDAVCAGAGAMARRSAADGQVRWSVPVGEIPASGPLRASADGILLAQAGSVRSFDAATGNAGWSLPVTNGKYGSGLVGIGLPAGGRVGVAVADCVEDGAGCTVAFRQVSLSAGISQNPVTVENVSLDATGASLRDGDDVISTMAVEGGERAAVRVRLAAAADGVPRWETAYPFEPDLYVYGTRTVVGSNYVAVAVAVHSTPDRFAQWASGSAGVILFDRATGAVRWTAWFGSGLYRRYAFETPALAVDAQGQLVLGNSFFFADPIWGRTRDSEILRLFAADGAVAWRVPAGFDLQPDVRRLGDDIAAAYPNGIARIALADGHQVWYAAGASLQFSKLVTLPGNDPVVFGNSQSGNAPTISRLDYATGAEKWRRAYGDGVRRYVTPLAAVQSNGELTVAGGWYVLEQTPLRTQGLRKPYAMRLDAASGNVAAYTDRPIGTALNGLYSNSNIGADGRWWVTESRRFNTEGPLISNWLTELDADGQALGSQALRIITFSDRQRRTYGFPLEAPQANRLLLGGIARGGNAGDGLSTSMIDTTATATGDLAVTLDAVPLLRPGKPFAYGATVTYAGSAPVDATLAVQLPWAEAGTYTCTAPGGECTIDTRNGWLEAHLRLPPGGTVRVAGTTVARELDGTYGSTIGGPMFMAAVVGDTALRETAIDNNHAYAQASMSLFANGFE